MKKSYLFFLFIVVCVLGLLFVSCKEVKSDSRIESFQTISTQLQEQRLLENHEKDTLSELETQLVQSEYSINETTIKQTVLKPILFCLNNLYGYIDTQMQVIIAPIYDYATFFSDNGYAIVRHKTSDGLRDCRILDNNGNILFQAQTAMMYNFYDDIISYRPEDKNPYRILRFRNNAILVDGLGEKGDASEDGIILVRFFENNQWAYINFLGERLFPDLKLTRMCRAFREQRAVIGVLDNGDVKLHIIDMMGNILDSLDFYRLGQYFSEGLLPAQTRDGLTGYLNKNGDFAFTVPIMVDNPDYIMASLMATDFKGGYALIQTQENPSIWRVINSEGQYVSDELLISYAYSFCDGLGLVRVNEDKYGYINTDGDFVINPMFEKADSFNSGYARIIYQGRDGILNTEGQLFWSDEIIEK